MHDMLRRFIEAILDVIKDYRTLAVVPCGAAVVHGWGNFGGIAKKVLHILRWKVFLEFSPIPVQLVLHQPFPRVAV